MYEDYKEGGLDNSYCMYIILSDHEDSHSVLIYPYNASNSSLDKSCCSVDNCSNCSASDGSCTITEQVECYINEDNLQR